MTARYTKNATFLDGSPRRFAGVHRPTLADATEAVRKNPAIAPYSCWEPDVLRQYWERGNFDYPLYHIEEDEQT